MAFFNYSLNVGNNWSDSENNLSNKVHFASFNYWSFSQCALLSPFNIIKTNALVKKLAVCNSDVIFLVAFMGERLSCKFNLHDDPPRYQWEKDMFCGDSIDR